MQETWQPFLTEQDLQIDRPCTCFPLSLLEESEEERAAFSVTPAFRYTLHTLLKDAFPRTEALSLFLLHIAQFKYIQASSASTLTHRRVSYHPAVDLQEQILRAVRRCLRASDRVIVDEQGAGAALLFPQVDQESITHIARRISDSVDLLQAETLVPPLQYETEIVTGFAAYPDPASSIEELVQHAGEVRTRIMFRPAVVPRLERARPRAHRLAENIKNSHSPEARLLEARVHGIPFMQIPSHLPARLKQLIPYSLAVKLRCAPVGRNHKQLTVAMANPLDKQALYRLHQATGMVIFPVSCEIAALDTLLASSW